MWRIPFDNVVADGAFVLVLAFLRFWYSYFTAFDSILNATYKLFCFCACNF